MAGSRQDGGDGAGAWPRQQRQEHDAEHAAGTRPARPGVAHCRTPAGDLPDRRSDVQRVGRVGSAAPPRAVGAPLPPRARSHLRRRLLGPSQARGGPRGAGAYVSAPGHVRAPRAAARVRQQVRRAARSRAHANRLSALPGAHHRQAVAHLRVGRGVGRRARGRRVVAREADQTHDATQLDIILFYITRSASQTSRGTSTNRTLNRILTFQYPTHTFFNTHT